MPRAKSISSSAMEIPDAEMLVYLRDLEKQTVDGTVATVPADFRQTILEVANNSSMLDACKSFLEIASKKVADLFCAEIEKVLALFVTKDASWGKDQRKESGAILTASFGLFKTIVEHLDKPPSIIFRRLVFFHNNIFIIQRHAEHEPSIKTFFNLLLELCETWFLLKRSEDAYRLMANCFVVLLGQKLTLAALTRMNSWSEYWSYFKIEPLTARPELRELFRDLPKEDWEDESTGTSDLEKPLKAVLEIESVPYLADAVFTFMCHADIGGKSDTKTGKTSNTPTVQKARKFLTSLLSVNADFVRLARIAIDKIMDSDAGARRNDQLNGFADVIVQTWSALRKAEDPVRGDLEAFIISDLMKRSLMTLPGHKKNYLNKYRLMVCSMYYENDVAARSMFHKNFDDMVLDGVNSSNDIVKSNALVMLGKCFPMVGPDTSKKERLKQIKEQAAVIITNLKIVKHHLRAAAATASGHVIGRGWTLLNIEDRTEMMRQVCERLVYDASSVDVRLAAVQAALQFLDQPLAHTFLVPLLAGMREVATDESPAVRLEYYHLLHKAIELKLDMDKISDMEQMLAHYLERDRPYSGVIGSILDLAIWKVDGAVELKNFLMGAIALFKTQPAVASKCFQNIPKGKSPKEIHDVLMAIFGQVFNAVRRDKSIFSMDRPDDVNIVLELAGTIWAATVLELSKDEKMNREVQYHAKQLLRELSSTHDKIHTINLYRIACRLPLDPIENTDPTDKLSIRDYLDYCLNELENTADVEAGVTLMTFINVWGLGKEMIDRVTGWMTKETGKKWKGTLPEDRRTHLGLQYIALSLSDPDISGHFESLEQEVERLTIRASELFLENLPKRFAAKFDPAKLPVEDTFFCIVPVLMSLCWLNRIRYEKDCTKLKSQFQRMIVALKDNLFERLGLGAPPNVVYAIEHHKSSASDQKKADNSTLLADHIVKLFRGIIAEIADIAKTDDEELHLLLRGHKNDAPVQLTLVTPPDAVPVAKKAKKAPVVKRNRRKPRLSGSFG